MSSSSNHPSRNIAMYNKTISWKRTNSLVNILKNKNFLFLFSKIDVAKNTHRQAEETNTYQTQIAFSIIWTRQAPRGLVGSSVIISDPAVPGLNFTAVSSLFLCYFFFSSKWGQRKISKSFACSAMASAHARQRSLYCKVTNFRTVLNFVLLKKY